MAGSALQWSAADVVSRIDWDTELAAVVADATALGARESFADAADLVEWLAGRDDVLARALRLGGAATLLMCEDVTDTAVHARTDAVREARRPVDRLRQRLRDLLADVGADELDRWRREQPALEDYASELEGLVRLRSFVADEAVAAVLDDLRPVFDLPGRVVGQAAYLSAVPTARDANGEEHDVAMSSFVVLTTSPDRELRRNTFEALAGIIERRLPLTVAALHASMTRDVVTARARGFESALDMHLASQGISGKDYRRLLDGIVDAFASALPRMVEARRVAAGLDELWSYDLYAPTGAEDASTYSQAEVRALVLDALQVLGPVATSILERAFDEGWIGWGGGPSQPDGAFCTPVQGEHPFVYFLWDGSTGSAYTLAHELGHAVHVLLSEETCRTSAMPGAAGTPDVFLEMPPKVHELLLARHLIGTGDEASRQRHTWDLLDQLLRSVSVTTLAAVVEVALFDAVEQGGAVTTDLVERLSQETMARLFGAELRVHRASPLLWTLYGHIFAPTYPGSYPIAIAGAANVAHALEADPDGAARAWEQALRLGASRLPLDVVRAGGVDLTDEVSVRRLAEWFNRLVDVVAPTG